VSASNESEPPSASAHLSASLAAADSGGTAAALHPTLQCSEQGQIDIHTEICTVDDIARFRLIAQAVINPAAHTVELKLELVNQQPIDLSLGLLPAILQVFAHQRLQFGSRQDAIAVHIICSIDIRVPSPCSSHRYYM